MSRFNQTLIIILILQIGLGVFMLWPRSAGSQAGTPLLPDFTADSVTQLSISDGEGNTVVMAKSDNDWVLPEAGDFPADGSKITPLLEKLVDVQSGRLVTQTEDSHSRLEVGATDFNRRLQISRQNNQQDTLYLGSSAGAGATHVRVNDQAEVYLTGAVTAFEANAQASNWIDTQYITIPQSTTVAITIENENGTIALEKVGEEWTLSDLAAGEIVNQAAVTTLLNQTHAIRMTEPVGLITEADDLFTNPSATITIANDGQSYRLQVGDPDPTTNTYLFSASNSPYYVNIAQFTADAFTTKARAEFLELPPEGEGGTN